MHSSGKEDENTSITLNRESWKWKSLIKFLSTAPETTHQTAPKLESLDFPAQQFPPSLPSSIFLLCCTLKATEELGRAALQEGCAGLQRKSLALLLNSPGSAALSWVSGYRLLAPASSCNFSVVEKRDSFFSESPSHFSSVPQTSMFEERRHKGHMHRFTVTPHLFPLIYNRYFYLERSRVPHFTIQQSIFFKAWSKGKCCAVQMHINEVVSFLLIVGEALVLKEGETFMSSIIVILFRWKCHLLRSCYNCNKG